MSTTTTTTTAAPLLEPAAQAFAEATANPPFLSDLPPSEGRALVDEVQSGDIAKPDVDEEWITIAGGPTGEVKVRIVKPRHATGTLPVVLYIHGAGWVFGDAPTHDRLVRALAVGAGAAVVFPEYDRSPEVRYPVAIEQNYAVAQWVVENGAGKGLDAARFAVEPRAALRAAARARDHRRSRRPARRGARRTPTSCATPASRSPLSATRASSTTS
jgi:acetyl esterase